MSGPAARITDANPGWTSVSWRLRGLVRLVHPFPSALVAATVALMGLAAAWPAPRGLRLLATGGAMLLVQFWVGVVNDLRDRDLDAATKPWKPLVSGRVRLAHARALAGALPAGAAALVVPLGAAPTLLLSGVALALSAYNAGLKRSRWSWLPYVAFFPLIPAYAWAAAGRPLADLALAYPIGALLGVGVHLANAVPDLEGDSAHGAGGAVQALGPTGALAASWLLLVTAQAAGLGTGLWLGFPRAPLFGGIGLSMALLATSVLVSAGRPGPNRLQANFGLVALSAMALGVGWVAGAAWR